MQGLLLAGLNQQWGLSNELFVLGDSLVLTVLGQVSFMPILVLAARLCPEVCSCTSSLSPRHTLFQFDADAPNPVLFPPP